MIREGSKAEWKWGNGTASGKVIETYTSKVKKVISGTEVVRNGVKGNKALLIEQEDSSRVLKLESEVNSVK